jgi:UDP-N-acetylglucosamine 2-epimerase (hydrolysing)
VLEKGCRRTGSALLPSMRFAHFSELMKNAACMVGNSSAGVREAPFLGLPSLDIGTRQSNRSDAPSVTACDAGDRAAILGFLSDHWGREPKPHHGFGQGSAAERFVQVLARPDFWSLSLQKAFRDIG